MAGRSILIKFIGDSKGLNDAADGVTGRLGKIKTAVGEADGFFGKLKAGGGAALESVGGAGAVAAAGVAAAAAAAYKGVNDFKDLGIEVGHFVDATGTAPEAASRLIEVAGDVGISAGELEGSIGKMNKAAAATPQLFKDLGVDIVKTKDGLVDTNATFLNAVDRLNAIKDPADRAEAASRLFGRGWQGMAELIGKGTPDLKAALQSVSDQKIFDQGKIDEARGLRDSFDQIRDAGQDLFLTIGQALAPVINDLAPLIAKNVENVKPLVAGLGKLIGAALKVVGPIMDITNAISGPFLDAIGSGAEKLGKLIDAVSGLGDEALSMPQPLIDSAIAMARAKDEANRLAEAAGENGATHDMRSFSDAANDAKDATKNLEDAYKELKGELDAKSAWLSVEDEIDNYKAKMKDASASNRDKQQAIIDLKGKLLDYLGTLKDVPKETQTQVLALIDQGKFDQAESALAWLGRNRDVTYNPQTGGQAPTVPHKARGGAVSAGQAYVVGDNPDGSLNRTSELFVPNTSGTIIPAGRFGIAGGSPPPAVTVQVFGAEESFVREIDRTITRVLRGMM